MVTLSSSFSLKTTQLKYHLDTTLLFFAYRSPSCLAPCLPSLVIRPTPRHREGTAVCSEKMKVAQIIAKGCVVALLLQTGFKMSTTVASCGDLESNVQPILQRFRALKEKLSEADASKKCVELGKEVDSIAQEQAKLFEGRSESDRKKMDELINEEAQPVLLELTTLCAPVSQGAIGGLAQKPGGLLGGLLG